MSIQGPESEHELCLLCSSGGVDDYDLKNVFKRMDKIKYLIEKKGLSVNCVCENGSPLFNAIMGRPLKSRFIKGYPEVQVEDRNYEIITYLLRKGATLSPHQILILPDIFAFRAKYYPCDLEKDIALVQFLQQVL